MRPKASENVTLPDPLPECIEKIEESKDLYCPVCELSVNSQQQLTQHLGSTKHKLVSLGLLPKPSDDPTIKRVVRSQDTFQGLKNISRGSINAKYAMSF